MTSVNVSILAMNGGLEWDWGDLGCAGGRSHFSWCISQSRSRKYYLDEVGPNRNHTIVAVIWQNGSEALAVEYTFSVVGIDPLLNR